MEEDKRLAEELKPAVPKGQDPAVLQFYLDILNKARDERAMARKEFDGATFEQDYERNREVLLSFLKPKINQDDVRVNSGVAEKKLELMQNELLAMNFQPEISAYDRNNQMLRDLSVELTDIVKKTNDIEKDEDLYVELIQDLLSQRVAIIEERIEDMDHGYNPQDLPGRKYACKRRISPLQLYPEDLYISCHRLQEQPSITIYDRKLYEEGVEDYGDNENWPFVKPGTNMHDEYLGYFKYRFSSLKQDEIEIITILMKTSKGIERQVIINGVMMYEPKSYLKCKNYPLAAVTVKTIPDFFYGKPPIASAKYLAGLKDESIRNAVLKFRQAVRAPLGVKSGKVYSRDIWSPGAVTQGLDKDSFSRLIDHDGITASEYQFLQMVDKEIEQFIGSPSLESEAGGKKTATEVLALQKLAIKSLGLSVLAVMRLKRDATFLRINSFFEEYLKAVGKRVIGDEIRDEYRKFEIDNGRTADGVTAKKYITFIDRQLAPEELKGVRKREKDEAKREGKKVKYSFLNVKMMENFILDFKVVVTPESRDSSSLDQVLFQDRLSQAMAISQATGKGLNADKVIEDFENAWKTKGMFSNDPMPVAPPGSPPGAPPIAPDAQGEALMKGMAMLPGSGTRGGMKAGIQQTAGR